MRQLLGIPADHLKVGDVVYDTQLRQYMECIQAFPDDITLINGDEEKIIFDWSSEVYLLFKFDKEEYEDFMRS